MDDVTRMKRAEARELLASYNAQVRNYGKAAAGLFIRKALVHTQRRWGSAGEQEVRQIMRDMAEGVDA